MAATIDWLRPFFFPIRLTHRQNHNSAWNLPFLIKYEHLKLLMSSVSKDFVFLQNTKPIFVKPP